MEPLEASPLFQSLLNFTPLPSDLSQIVLRYLDDLLFFYQKNASIFVFLQRKWKILPLPDHYKSHYVHSLINLSEDSFLFVLSRFRIVRQSESYPSNLFHYEISTKKLVVIHQTLFFRRLHVLPNNEIIGVFHSKKKSCIKLYRLDLARPRGIKIAAIQTKSWNSNLYRFDGFQFSLFGLGGAVDIYNLIIPTVPKRKKIKNIKLQSQAWIDKLFIHEINIHHLFYIFSPTIGTSTRFSISQNAWPRCPFHQIRFDYIHQKTYALKILSLDDEPYFDFYPVQSIEIEEPDYSGMSGNFFKNTDCFLSDFEILPQLKKIVKFN